MARRLAVLSRRQLMRVALAGAVAGVLAFASGTALAQPPAPPTGRQPGQRAMVRTDADRDSLELRVRQRMAHVLKTQLGLTDDQLRRLQASNARFEDRRRDLFQREREARGALREAMGDSTRQAEVGTLLDRVIAVQRQRVDLLEEEQRELSTFLTPLQRARYYGMEEQIRRRVQEMRDNDRSGSRRMVSPAPRDGVRRPGTRQPPAPPRP